MRILWSANAPWAASGYGIQSKHILPRFQALGHEVGIFAWYGLAGGCMKADLGGGPIQVYPMHRDLYGNDIVAHHARHFRADLLVTLIDIWVLDPAAHQAAGAPWCLPGHTLIPLADGRALPIQDIVEQRLDVAVVGCDGYGAVATPIKAYHSIPGSVAGEIIEIVTEQGLRLEVTADNEIAVVDDMMRSRWMPAGALSPGMMVYCDSSRPLGGDNAASAQGDQSRSAAHRQLPATVNTGWLGLSRRDHGRRGDDQYPASDQAADSPHTPAHRFGSEHQRGAVAVVNRASGYADSPAQEGLYLGPGSIQVCPHDVLHAPGMGLQVLQPAGPDRAVLDRESRAGQVGEAVYRESSAASGAAVQRPIYRRGGGPLVAGARLEPQAIRTVSRRGRAYETVYDLTTSTGNFIAGNILIHNCAYFPVDHAPVSEIILERVRQCDYPVQYSQFGLAQTQARGIECGYIPHGVGPAYTPGDKAAARRDLGLPQEAFICSMVAANKGFPDRKGFQWQLEAFAHFRARHPEALLYLHMSRNEAGGIPMDALLAALGIPPEAVRFVDQYAQIIGLPDEYLADIYRASDVLLAAACAEGFGIPIIEAQAAGCPVITTNFSAMPELTVNGIATEPAGRFYQPLFTAWQAIPSVANITAALETIYGWSTSKRRKMSAQGVAHMQANYSWDYIVEHYWKDMLARVERGDAINPNARRTNGQVLGTPKVEVAV